MATSVLPRLLPIVLILVVPAPAAAESHGGEEDCPQHPPACTRVVTIGRVTLSVTVSPPALGPDGDLGEGSVYLSAGGSNDFEGLVVTFNASAGITFNLGNGDNRLSSSDNESTIGLSVVGVVEGTINFTATMGGLEVSPDSPISISLLEAEELRGSERSATPFVAVPILTTVLALVALGGRRLRGP